MKTEIAIKGETDEFVPLDFLVSESGDLILLVESNVSDNVYIICGERGGYFTRFCVNKDGERIVWSYKSYDDLIDRLSHMRFRLFKHQLILSNDEVLNES
jgi:hypothetical protein